MSARQSVGVVLCVALGLCCGAEAADWPQLQNGPGHTGYTAEGPRPPLRVKWTRSLGEPTFPGAQPIVADGRLYVGTCWGNLLALDRNTGRTLWVYKTGAPVLGTPAFEGGVVYATSMDRHCHAVDARDGTRRWAFPTEEGISAGPVVADGKVFIAGRDAIVYALDARDGSLVWKSPVGAMVMATPAWASGVLYVGAGDNRVYALDGKTGREIWKSEGLPGMAIRDYWLVASGPSVIATTQLVNGAHATYDAIEKGIMAPFREANHGKMLVQDELIEKLRGWFVAHPHQQTLHVLDAATGKRRFVAPIVQVHGGGCTGPLPVIAPDGACYVVYANVRLQASGWAFPGRLDLETGRLEPLIKGRYWIDKDQWEWQPKPGTEFGRRSTFDTGFCVSDQSWGLSLAGGRLLTVRDPGWPEAEPSCCALDLKTGEDRYLCDERTRLRQAVRDGRYGGAFHATCSPMIVSGKHVFHKAVRNVIVCFEGD